jgi:hypothetical protein
MHFLSNPKCYIYEIRHVCNWEFFATARFSYSDLPGNIILIFLKLKKLNLSLCLIKHHTIKIYGVILNYCRDLLGL